MNSSFGPLLVGLGILIVVLGILAWSGGLGWIGKLPGDIRFVRGSTRVYFPFASMLIISIVLSLAAYFFRR